MKKLAFAILAVLLAVASVPAQDWAKARLEKSPRHLDWVKVKHGDREVNWFIAFPEVKDKATAVIVIHEIFGLTDWVRGVTDQLAEAGYIVIAPDLLSGRPLLLKCACGWNGADRRTRARTSAEGQDRECGHLLPK